MSIVSYLIHSHIYVQGTCTLNEVSSDIFGYDYWVQENYNEFLHEETYKCDIYAIKTASRNCKYSYSPRLSIKSLIFETRKRLVIFSQLLCLKMVPSDNFRKNWIRSIVLCSLYAIHFFTVSYLIIICILLSGFGTSLLSLCVRSTFSGTMRLPS